MSMLFNRLAAHPAPGTGSCPYLGIAEDAQTCLAYASEWNLCHHVRRPSGVKLEHQRASCLLGAHTACPVFQSAQPAATLPVRLRERRAQAGLGKWALLLALLVTGLLVVSWALWWRNGQISTRAAPGVSAQAAQAHSPRTALPAASSDTPAAQEHCGYALEERIDLGQAVLVLHRVRSGENMDLLAEEYGTSVQAIRAVNYFLPTPLWSDLVIVIPAGSPESAGTPVFEPYQVPEPGAPLASLDAQFSLTAGQLAQSNALDADCPAVSGWVLVPRPARVNP